MTHTSSIRLENLQSHPQSCFPNMAPKAAKLAKGTLKLQDGKRDEPLQAIVLADSFETRFKPLTINKPRVSRHALQADFVNLT